MNPKMSHLHPDHEAEQAHIDRAYDCLERSKTDAWRIRDLNEASTGGTFQARYERNAFDEQLLARLTQLDLGDAALVFGRIDRAADADAPLESFHIGRLAVAPSSSTGARPSPSPSTAPPAASPWALPAGATSS